MNGRSAEVEPISPSLVQNNGHHPRTRQGLEWAWLLWDRRRLLLRWTLRGMIAALLLALLIPKRYESITRLMPSDSQSAGPMAMLAAMGGKGSAPGMIPNDFLSVKDPRGALVGLLGSDTPFYPLIYRLCL